MLLRVLSQRPGITKFAIEGEKPAGNDTSVFLVSGFRIRFERGEQDNENLFDSLYRRCAERGILRKLENLYAGKQTAVMRLVYAGKIATALDELQQHLTDAGDKDEAVLTAGRFHALEAGKERMDSRDYVVERNRIAYQAIQLAKKLKP
jgi:hypothetical protein